MHLTSWSGNQEKKFLAQINEYLVNGNPLGVSNVIKKALAAGLEPERILSEGLLPAMEMVGLKFESNEFYVPEVLMAARAMQTGLKALHPTMAMGSKGTIGRVVIGTVEGDIHDIGKNLVAMILEGAGFEVIDLGVNVSAAKFVEAIVNWQPTVVGMSALLTLTRNKIKETIQAIQEAGLRDQVGIMVGGAPVTRDFAEEAGADAYACGVQSVIDKALELAQKRGGGTAAAQAQELDLAQLVDLKALRQFQESFTSVTGIGLAFIDTEGNSILGIDDFLSSCSECERLYRDRERREQQLEVPLLISSDIDTTGDACIYSCRAGLIEISVPIVVEGTTIGAIICGHVLVQKETDTGEARHQNEVRPGIQVLSLERLKAVVKLLQAMADYVVRMGLASLNEKKVRENRYNLVKAAKTQLELEKALAEAELKALQSQVNPHFLFNALNTISRLAFLEGAEETEHVADCLALMLRYNLRRINGNVTVAEEIDQIKNYLYIQKVRFGERLESVIDVSEEAMQARIPIMVLQPLVENAIVHGIELSSRGGRVEIRGYRRGNDLVLEVKDNGVGMTEAKSREVEQMLSTGTKQGNTTSIGLANIHRRLQAFFGSDYGLYLESKMGEGTRVGMIVPLIAAEAVTASV